MRKIPTLFKRDPDDMSRVLPEVTPGCEWVLAGEGTPTRKFDGTLAYETSLPGDGLAPGTFELCGPKLQGNPERFEQHRLIAHATADQFAVDAPFTFDRLREVVVGLGGHGIEGIVWHHPDGRMAKLKARDFPHPRSVLA